MESENEISTFYAVVGGDFTFKKLAEYFYHNIKENPILLPLYPADDLAGAQKRLEMFLAQYWGGPKTYSEERGHPRLRLRHNIFKITQTESTAWLNCMEKALTKLKNEDKLLNSSQYQEMWNYFQNVALALINSY